MQCLYSVGRVVKIAKGTAIIIRPTRLLLLLLLLKS